MKFISPDEFYFVADYDPKAEWALETAGGNTDEAAALLKEEADYTVFDQLPFWSNGEKYFTIQGPNKEKIEFVQIL